MDQVVLLLGQAVNTCVYIRRFNILMSFISDKEKVKIMLKENAEASRDNEKILFGPKFEEDIAKSLTSKCKLRTIFGNLTQ